MKQSSSTLHAAAPQSETDPRAVLSRASVAVLLGGRSSEREVSLQSGAAILAALRESRPAGVARGPRQVTAIEIEASGAWQYDGQSFAALRVLELLAPDTLFFLALHGGEGENGSIQGLLEACDRRYTGSGVAASALCMNKHATRLVLREAGLSTAAGCSIEHDEWRDARALVLERVAALSDDGWYVKPNSGGSSVSTYCVEPGAQAALARALDDVLATGDRALVEARVRGCETTCAVLGNQGGALRALAPVEIVPHAGRFFDYEEKYSGNGASEFCPPRSLSAHSIARVQQQALRAHRAAACDGYSRTDFIVPRDAQGQELEPVVLEINTLPGMTARSLLPQAAAQAGMDMRELCLAILELALTRTRAAPVRGTSER